MTTRADKPFEGASFPHRQRYGIRKGSTTAVTVTVDGQVCVGEVLGRNGPRVQVRFGLAGRNFVRWFDLLDVTDLAELEDPSPATGPPARAPA
jgi:hypothetical protein